SNRKSMRWIIAAVLAVVLCVCLCFGVACKKTNDEAQGTPGYFTKVAPPKNADPMDGSGNTNNVNYIAYVLEQQTEWTAVSDSEAKAAGGINDQQIWTYKWFKDGYMLTNQKSYSAFSKEAFQALFVTGRQGSEEEERGVYLRDGSKPSNKKNTFDDVEWGTTDDDITYLLEQDYYRLHGLFSDEISVFVINDETVEEAGDVKKNSDGTYTQKFVLDTDDSVYWYQYSMKNHGGLSTFPAFSKVEATFTFDANFRILKLETEEQSTVKKGMTVQNKTSATTTYCYPDMDDYEPIPEDVKKEATDYFGKYYGQLEPDEGGYTYNPEATDILLGAIGGMLSPEGEYYTVAVQVGDIYADGYMYAAIDINSMDLSSLMDSDDDSDIDIMSLITLVCDVYGNTNIKLTLNDADGNEALYVDLLSGTNTSMFGVLGDLLGGKLVGISLSDSLLMGEDEAQDTYVPAYGEFLVMPEYTEDDYTNGGLAYTYPRSGQGAAQVSYIGEDFYMVIDCYVEPNYISADEIDYVITLTQLVIAVPSVDLVIYMTLDTSGVKGAHVSPESFDVNLEAEQLVSDLIGAVLDINGLFSMDTWTDMLYSDYTFSAGTIIIDIDLTSIVSALGHISIEIDNVVITVGDVFDDFYVSFVGDLKASKYMYIFPITTASTIGFTYYDGKIIEAKDLNKDNPAYKCWETSEFVDALFASDVNESSIGWMLGTDSTVWSMISGVIDFFDVYDVRKLEEDAPEDTSKVQNLLDYLNIGRYVSGVQVSMDGCSGSAGNEIDVETLFGITDNYWAFEIDSDFIDDITDGILNNAVLVITHDDVSGIGGIYLVGTVYDMIDVTIKLGSYDIKASEEFDLSEGKLDLANAENNRVPNLYEYYLASQESGED
ncbi:MAG: hypothetical protein LUC17_02370, partial [Oscillospiraceae bacterium]|nr:hypothetical protein [Oscillospiraceae bacterium]